MTLRDLLPESDAGVEAIDDVPAFSLSKVWGAGAKGVGGGVAELLFTLPDRKLFVLLEITTT